MKIISIKKKNKNTTNCILTMQDSNDEPPIEIELSMDIVVNKKLSKGMVISKECLEGILKEQRIIDVKQTSYNYISYRMRSEMEIKNKLRLLSFTEEEIHVAISFLYEFDYLDDELYAKKLIKNTLIKKKIGKNGVIKLLQEKGINKTTIEKTIKECYPDDDIDDMLFNVARKKKDALTKRNKSNDKIKSSLFNHIIAKGFSFEEAKKVVSKVMNEECN